jgi:hypothetical protein
MENHRMTSLPSVAQLLRLAGNRLSERYRIFLFYILVPAGTILIINALNVFRLVDSSLFASDTQSWKVFLLKITYAVTSTLHLNYRVGLLLGGALLFSLMIIIYVGILCIFARTEQKRSLDYYFQALRIFPAYLWVFFLLGLLVLAGSLLIIPGLIFTVWFFFAPIVLVVENVHGKAALSRSKQLSAGKFWSVVWRIAGIFTISFLFRILSNIIPEISLPMYVSKTAGFVLLAVYHFGLVPFMAAYMVVLYESLVANQKQSADISIPPT